MFVISMTLARCYLYYSLLYSIHIHHIYIFTYFMYSVRPNNNVIALLASQVQLSGCFLLTFSLVFPDN